MNRCVTEPKWRKRRGGYQSRSGNESDIHCERDEPQINEPRKRYSGHQGEQQEVCYVVEFWNLNLNFEMSPERKNKCKRWKLATPENPIIQFI
ncbi:hypothetical protein D910_05956 [Dendroctonus ponderosae]|uniref:Uncharacterized protein n=1 Tax=Dendroctonus ponderosae TaxID=77166 RepID=U4UD99_DENPD|nr:hypothetical protein D910_05956 [Dendroctonus ponderosae]KAH1019004.1 hypothetical protein HUJ05_006671 [Dendroctonus ponderosae]